MEEASRYGTSYVSETSVTQKGSIDYLLETKQRGGDKMRSLLLKSSFVVAIFAQILVFDSRAVFAWFATGQDADIMLSGIDFNNTGGALLFNHPMNITTDGTRLLLADTRNNRILIWNSLPGGNVAPDPDGNPHIVHYDSTNKAPSPYRALRTGALTQSYATASSVNSSPSTDPGISGAYLLAFHACDPDVSDCNDPRNHRVYLAQSDDGVNWSVVPGWETYKGSVPDVIRRGDTLYVYTPNKVRRYDFATETWESPVSVELTDTESPDGFVDPSLIIDDQDRLVLFYLVGIIGQDPAGCAPGETSCVKHFRSATEVDGSDGAQFVADSGDRVQVTIIPPSTASDPDIFYDGNRYVIYIARGQSIQVYTSQTLLGDYTLLSTLLDGYLTHDVGVGSGYFDQATSRYWTYGHTFEGIIRRAVHASLDESLSDSDFTTVLTGSSIGLGASYLVQSPGFAVNTTGINDAPTVTTNSASSVTSSSATLNGTVNPNGEATTYYFEYGVDTSYGSTTSSSSAGSGTSAVSVNAPISGLISDTTYHYRLVATNIQGTSYGDDKTFSTTIIYVDTSGSCDGNTPCYTTIQAAIDGASSGSVIKIMAGTYPENLDLNSSNNYTLQGGWDSTYTSQSSNTTVNSLTISSGTLTAEYLVCQ